MGKDDVFIFLIEDAVIPVVFEKVAGLRKPKDN
jgi:hypothetical protein